MKYVIHKLPLNSKDWVPVCYADYKDKAFEVAKGLSVIPEFNQKNCEQEYKKYSVLEDSKVIAVFLGGINLYNEKS